MFVIHLFKLNAENLRLTIQQRERFPERSSDESSFFLAVNVKHVMMRLCEISQL